MFSIIEFQIDRRVALIFVLHCVRILSKETAQMFNDLTIGNPMNIKLSTTWVPSTL